MSLFLSHAELGQLEATLRVLASPLAYEDVTSWRAASRAATEALVGAALSVSWLPMAGEPLMLAPESGDEVFARSQEYFHGDDPAIARWRRERYPVASQLEAYPLDEPRTVAWYHDLVRPLGLHRALYLMADADGEDPASLMLFLPPDATDDEGAATARGLALLRLVSPAYQSGVRHCLRLHPASRSFERAVDALADGVALCDARGRLVHRNPALARLVDADPDGARLVTTIAGVAQSVAALVERRRAKSAAPPVDGEAVLRELRTAHARYRLHASHVAPDLAGLRASVAVLVGRLAPDALTAVELAARFGLTAREAEVARLLALGRSNAQVAHALGLRATTARHYTEHVLAKLGLTTRAGVAAALRP